MKKRAKSLISLLMVLAMLLTLFSSVSLFGGLSAEAATVVENIKYDGSRSIELNDDWQFHLAIRTPSVLGGGSDTNQLRLNFANNGLEDVAGYATEDIIRNDYDDSAWRTLNVPHDFSIEGQKTSGQQTSQGYLQGGLGWYRKTFVLPASMQDKRLTIDFEGVYQNSVVYLNGKEIGNYPNGYTGFALDITDDVTFGDGKPNVLVVKVQNMSPSGRWYTGSGIVRPVHLIVNDPVRIVRNGVVLTTPDIETEYKADGSASLNVEAKLYSNATNGIVRLKTTVLDKDGKAVAVNSTDNTDINPSTSVVINDVVNVPNVNLWYTWNLGDPYLYTIKTDLYFTPNGGDGERLVDTVETKFGFRWFRIDTYDSADADQGGLYINDKYTKINGVDLHHDSGSLGAVSIKDAYERQFSILKSMGVNSYRTSHCPPSKQVIEVCSEMGFVVMEEAYDGWGAAKSTYDFGCFFLREVPSDWAGLIANGLITTPQPAVNYDGAKYLWSDWVIREFVSRDINEAAVYMWSIGNEIRSTTGTTYSPRPDWYDGTKYNERAGNIASSGITSTTLNEYTEAVRLGEGVKAVDPTRQIGMGGDQERSVPGDTSVWHYINQYLDAYGLNYNSAISVDGLNTKYPNTIFFESESSSQTSSRGVYMDANVKNSAINQTPGRRGGSNYDNDFASWTMSNEYGLKKDRDRKSFLGQYIWSGFDYIGEPTPYSVFPVGVSSFGTIDTAGFPKDSYYLFRSQWTDKNTNPMVHIVPGNWNDWREGEEVEIWVNANVQTVELFQNGVSLGTKSFDIKKTAYGLEYYETSELNPDDKTWTNNSDNPSGYKSTGATVVSASGDSQIAEGSNFGRLHLTWKVPFKSGEIVAKAYTDPSKTTLVAEDKVATAGSAYTIKLDSNKKVIKADGRALTYVECTVVDANGNMVPKANNLLKFDVTGGAVVGVDNGQQESDELYKWGNVERNSHSERSAYSGKALVILQSNKDEIGTMQLTVSSKDLKSAVMNIAVTADGTGDAPAASMNPVLTSIQDTMLATVTGTIPALPAFVNVNYADDDAGYYSVKTAVTWDAITPAQVASAGSFTIQGTLAGIAEKAQATVYVAAAGAKSDISTNTALGANNTTFNFAGLAANSTLRNGALATATFTSGTSLYPNNMVNGSDSNYWNNVGTRAASVLLPAYTWTRTGDTVEFFWDSQRLFNEIDLRFNITTTGTSHRYDVPDPMKVQYWDGGKWVDAANLTVDKATAAYEVTTLNFDAVITDRVRVEMTNQNPATASPYTGAIQIRNAVVMGWNLTDEMPIVNAVEGISLDQTSTYLPLGNELTLNAAIIPENATNQTVRWSSDKPAVASVEDGKVKGLAEGAATISVVTQDGGYRATCVVQVVKPVESITLNRSKTSIIKGTSDKLTATILPADATVKSVVWKSSNDNIVSVDQNGAITAKTNGMATITVTTVQGNLVASCAVTVQDPPANIYTVKSGEYVSVPITIKDCVKMVGVQGKVAYDRNYLTLETIMPENGFMLQFSGENFIAAIPGSDGLDGDVVIGTMYFKTKANLDDDIMTYITFPEEYIKIGDNNQNPLGATIPAIAVEILGAPPLQGDVNLDGVVDVFDTILMLQYCAKYDIEFSRRQFRAGDVNGDGIINTADVIIVMQLIVQQMP